MSIMPVVVGEKELCRGRRFTFKQYVINVGSREIVKDVLAHPGAVVILPLIEHEVIMLRQYRPGPRRWIYELPAGTVEEGEDPEETARRELLEETGYEAQDMRLLFKMYPSPGVSTELMYMYLATNLVRRSPSPEEDEILEVVRLPYSRVLEMIYNGEIVDGKTIALILYYHVFVRSNKATG